MPKKEQDAKLTARQGHIGLKWEQRIGKHKCQVYYWYTKTNNWMEIGCVEGASAIDRWHVPSNKTKFIDFWWLAKSFQWIRSQKPNFVSHFWTKSKKGVEATFKKWPIVKSRAEVESKQFFNRCDESFKKCPDRKIWNFFVRKFHSSIKSCSGTKKHKWSSDVGWQLLIVF